MLFDLASLSDSTSKNNLNISKFFTSLSPYRDHGNNTNKLSPSSNSEVNNFDNNPLVDFSPAHLLDKVDDGSFGNNE